MCGQWEPLKGAELKSDTVRAMLHRPCICHAQALAMAHQDLGSSPGQEDLASGSPHWQPAFS